ncbi:MAG: hypothetical protein R3A12_04085 [Ignavibacteria bacterium]
MKSGITANTPSEKKALSEQIFNTKMDVQDLLKKQILSGIL